jgi:hypothetical protein
MRAEDIADGARVNRIAKVGERSPDAPVAPRAIFVDHAHHKVLNLLRDLWSSRLLARYHIGRFLDDEVAIPALEGIGCRDGFFGESEKFWVPENLSVVTQ